LTNLYLIDYLSKYFTMTAIEFGNNLMNQTACLTRLAVKLTSDEDDAKDLVQETFFKSLKYCDKFVDESSLKAWTSTIMKNTFINSYRKNVLHTIYRDQNKELLFYNQANNTGYENPDSAYSVIEITQQIEQLKDKFRTPFKMHLSGFKYREIADALTVDLGTVKSRIFIAKRQLREKLLS
jgi:RNA polymerase sigma-70 factor, ECF subfamily